MSAAVDRGRRRLRVVPELCAPAREAAGDAELEAISAWLRQRCSPGVAGELRVVVRAGLDDPQVHPIAAGFAELIAAEIARRTQQRAHGFEEGRHG